MGWVIKFMIHLTVVFILFGTRWQIIEKTFKGLATRQIAKHLGIINSYGYMVYVLAINKKNITNYPTSDIPDRMSGSKFYFVPNHMKTTVTELLEDELFNRESFNELYDDDDFDELSNDDEFNEDELSATAAGAVDDNSDGSNNDKIVNKALISEQMLHTDGEFAPYFKNIKYITEALMFCWIQKHNISKLVDIIHHPQFKSEDVVTNIHQFRKYYLGFPYNPFIFGQMYFGPGQMVKRNLDSGTEICGRNHYDLDVYLFKLMERLSFSWVSNTYYFSRLHLEMNRK
ncbi:hypothetical protein C1646_675069 [Rhizophagus diaphanus]|nr:hypothetical protein C1646_675069 [Rhizophagus diaphanus] [Rhizophagus sp. MUCL 43196]